MENKLSIVVPTHKRVDLLKELLSSIEVAATGSPVAVETIIVDDSPPAEHEQIGELCRRYGACLWRGTASVRQKRNLGIREASGDIVLFVDSDCTVFENIFVEHLRMYREPDTAGVLGLTEFRGPEKAAWRVVKRTRFLDAFFFAETLVNYVESAPWGTCTNLSIRKDVLAAVGGFESSFPFKLGGDDAELGIRLNTAGYKIRMNPAAVVYHTRETWNSFLPVLKRVFRWGRMDYYLYYEKYRDKLALSFPRPVTVLTLLLGACLLAGAVLYPVFLTLPLLWIPVFFVLNGLLRLRQRGIPLRELGWEILADMMQWVFDLGTMLESFKNSNLLHFFYQPSFDPRQAIILWAEKARETWSVLLSTMAVMLWVLLSRLILY